MIAAPPRRTRTSPSLTRPVSRTARPADVSKANPKGNPRVVAAELREFFAG